MTEQKDVAELTSIEIIEELRALYDTWPSNGWPKVAELAPFWENRSKVLEEELRRRHEATGSHEPAHPYYRRKCACRTVSLEDIVY